MCQRSLFIFFLQYLLNHDGCPPERSMTWVFSGWSVQQHDARITTSLLQLRIVGWSIPVAACLRLLLQNSHLLQRRLSWCPRKKKDFYVSFKRFGRYPSHARKHWKNSSKLFSSPAFLVSSPGAKTKAWLLYTLVANESQKKAMWGIKIWICAICASMQRKGFLMDSLDPAPDIRHKRRCLHDVGTAWSAGLQSWLVYSNLQSWRFAKS